MTEDPVAPSTPAPLWKRMLMWIAIAVVLALLALVAVHVMIPPVAADESAPAGHFGGPCVACHIVTEGTDGNQAEN